MKSRQVGQSTTVISVLTCSQPPEAPRRGRQCAAEYSLVAKLAECLSRSEDHHLVMPECEVAVYFVKELLQNIVNIVLHSKYTYTR